MFTDVLLCLQRVCKQLRLHPVGQPEEVPPAHVVTPPAQSYSALTVCVFVCLYRSSTGRPDWTCVVVGFTSGYVRFYTEVGWCFWCFHCAKCDLQVVLNPLSPPQLERRPAAGPAPARRPSAEAQVSHLRDPSTPRSH